MSPTKLFEPIQVGNMKLQHRVVLPPLTRFRADKQHVPFTDLVKEYYVQRSQTPGTLAVTEGVFIRPEAGGYDHVSGIWNKEQIASWKKIADAIHEAGGYVFMQLWALGRAAMPEVLEAENASYPYIGPSAIAMEGRPKPPRPLTQEEIKEYAQWYAQAAHNAVFEAGFDGVEIHGANGYLADQFMQDLSNERTDEYGGSIPNRSRFALEMVEAVVKAVGAERTAIRLSPGGTVQGMGMKDAQAQFGHFVTSLKAQHPNLAFLHLVEPRFVGVFEEVKDSGVTNDYVREIWAPKPLISSGGFTLESAKERADKTGDLVAFGRYFISNPDIVHKLKNNIPLTPYNRKTFYLPGDTTPTGYTDYPFADAEVAAKM